MKGTLTELCSRYWVVKSRLSASIILHQHTICHRFERKEYLLHHHYQKILNDHHHCLEDSDKLPLAAAESMARELSRTVLKGIRLGLVHGQMPADERDRVMRSFRQGEVRVLVATSVIEVGIDVPGATLMVVEHAERFGLAQLHQLRGRVGRGRGESHCVLIHYGARDDESRRRLEVMERTADGFEVAEADLRFRGAGEPLGARQAGAQGFRVAHLIRDHEVLAEARQEARDWLAQDPDLRSEASLRVREVLRHRWGDGVESGTWAD